MFFRKLLTEEVLPLQLRKKFYRKNLMKELLPYVTSYEQATKKQDTQKSDKMCTFAKIKTPPDKTLTFTKPLPLSTLVKNHQER